MSCIQYYLHNFCVARFHHDRFSCNHTSRESNGPMSGVKRYNLTPRSLWVCPLVSSQEGREIRKRTSRRFLMARITQNVRLVCELEFDLLFQRRQLEFHLQPPHFAALDRLGERSQREKTEECNARQKRTFGTLLNSTTDGNRQQCPSDRWVVNFHPGPCLRWRKRC